MFSRIAKAALTVKRPSLLYSILKNSVIQKHSDVESSINFYTKNNQASELNDCYELIGSNVKNDLMNMHDDIKNLFKTEKSELKEICDYYFDGTGKSIRPTLICSIARALNFHLSNIHINDNSMHLQAQNSLLMNSQRKIALIAEMIHVASLIHDDIIDNSDLRRGKTSVNSQWGCHKAVLAGDYVLGIASRELALLDNTRVVETLSLVLNDLVKGELMQLGAKEIENERFEHYSMKTYRKTASLIANSCKSVAILKIESLCKYKNDKVENDSLINMAYEFGKNIGIAFQLIDDVLDFTSHSNKLGKPGHGADLRLGLATAPVLFAATQFPQLNTMIMRRFSNEDDVHKAFDYVMKSNGINETRYLASKYCQNAESILNKLSPSSEVKYLKFLIKNIIDRKK